MGKKDKNKRDTSPTKPRESTKTGKKKSDNRGSTINWVLIVSILALIPAYWIFKPKRAHYFYNNTSVVVGKLPNNQSVFVLLGQLVNDGENVFLPYMFSLRLTDNGKVYPCTWAKLDSSTMTGSWQEANNLIIPSQFNFNLQDVKQLKAGESQTGKLYFISTITPNEYFAAGHIEFELTCTTSDKERHISKFPKPEGSVEGDPNAPHIVPK